MATPLIDAVSPGKRNEWNSEMHIFRSGSVCTCMANATPKSSIVGLIRTRLEQHASQCMV